MGSDEEGAQLAEVAVVLILDCKIVVMFDYVRRPQDFTLRTFSNAPEVLTALDDATIGGLNVLSASDDRERHGVRENAGVLSAGLVFPVDRRLVDSDSLSCDNLANLF